MKVSETELKFLHVISDTVNTFLKSKNKTITNNHELLKIIKRCLPHIAPGMEFNPYFVKVDSSNNPFILGIYPDLDELDAKSKIMIEHMDNGKTAEFLKEWASIKKWHIEIDSNVLTKGHRLCVDDGDQFVALLCHEVGHAVSGSPMALMKNYVYSKKVSNKLEAMITSKNPLVRKFALPMFVHTLRFKLVLKDADSIREELAADHFVPNEYRGALISYMENHILNSPDYSNIVTTKEDFDNEQRTSINFNKEAIRMMQRRKEVLKSYISAQYSKDDSTYMKDVVARMGKVAMGYNPDTNETNEVYEASSLRCLESDIIESEKKLSDLMESTTVTPRDIAILQVQADDIDTVDQKLFVVHTIYDYLEILHNQKAKILKKSSNPEMLEKAGLVQDEQIKTLNGILDKVMKIDTSKVGDRYGVFVKYPKGYEG